MFVGKDHVGAGDGELGYNLMKMALYTLSESDDVPASLLFMNAGVKLVAGGEQQVVDSVARSPKGHRGARMRHDALTSTGARTSWPWAGFNMYDILGHMQEAAKVITL